MAGEAAVRRILLPVTPDVPYRAAARQAAWLARRFGAGLLLLHVTDGPDDDWDLAEPDGLLDGVPVTRLLRQGPPARRILDVARAQGCGLIVMATQPRWHRDAALDGEIAPPAYRAFQRFLLHSVAAQVMDEAPCPVWTVPPLAADAPFAPRHALCAIDLKPKSADLLAGAAAFARDTGLDLTLVHATRSAQIYTAGLKTPHTQMWSDGLVEIASERIAALQRRAGTDAAVLIERGALAPAMAGAAAGADLVIAGHWRAEAHWQEPSGAFDMVRHAPVPVLVLPLDSQRRLGPPRPPRLHPLRDGVPIDLFLAGLALLAWLLFLFGREWVCEKDPTHPSCVALWREEMVTQRQNAP